MDISVLTEQRREMVINLLKGMKIRKSDGEGFDKDDVYACMQQLCDVYEKSIDDLTVGYETELGELQDKYQKYDENNDLYISLIMEAKKSSNEIINKAKSEVDEILAAGKEQIDLQEQEIARCREAAAREKEELENSLIDARKQAEAEKAELAAQVEAEKVQAEARREQYKDQMAVMDQEFDEIKMNILRTAGKIDGLRAQLEEPDQAAAWEVQDEPAPVDVPESNLVIEETAEAPAEAPEELTFEELVAKLQADDLAKAEETIEVEAPAEPPVVEPELPEAAANELETYEFNFEPTFDAPAEPAVEVPEVEVPAVEVPEVEVPEVELPEVEIPAEVPVEAPVEEIPVPEVEIPAAEDAVQVAEEGLADIEDLALEDISIDLPEEAPVEIQEEPIEEISFEGLEELFKE